MTDFHGSDETEENGASKPPVVPLRWAILGAILLILVSSAGTYVTLVYGSGTFLPGMQAAEELRESREWGRFLTAIGHIRSQYVNPEKADIDRLLRGATRGAVDSLDDPHSSFFDAENLEDFLRQTEGNYQGIGIQVSEQRVDENNYITVIRPFDGTPAAETPPVGADSDERPGLRAGDRIVKVDGRDVIDVPVEHVATMIRGPEGTTVELAVLREGREDPLVFEIERRRITVPTTDSRMLENGIGYLQIFGFSKATDAQVEEELDALSRAGMEALVLDLRNNPGGLLDTSVNVAALFVPEGPVVHVIDRDQQRTTHRSSTPAFGRPLVVLTNQFTASGAEILAAAIQDYGVGSIVGTATFGKGSVQVMFPLDERRAFSFDDELPTAGVKLTIARYLTANERSLDGEGVIPDHKVEVPDQTVLGQLPDDLQLERALELLRQGE